jgi:hypothetical protein
VSASGRRAAVRHGRHWREALQLMVCCFDASGHESDQPYLVVAGFVSSAGDWDDFSQLWLTRLRKDGLAYFHASKFDRYEDIFEVFRHQTARRHALTRDLMDLILSHAYRYFVQGVKPLDFNHAFTVDERRMFNMNSYALCGRTCVSDLGRWIRGDALEWKTRVPDLIFEQGDIGKGKLRDLLVKHHYPEPQFLPGKVPLKTKLGLVEPFVPLQAADWLAYESFRLLRSGKGDDRDTWRWPMRTFHKQMHGSMGFWQRADMEQSKDDWRALGSGDDAMVILAQASEAERFT